MILLAAMVPLYILIPEFFPPRIRHVPELGIDRAIPLIPSWALMYGALYVFLILLPVVVVRQEQLIQRTFFAYLLIWITSYIFFFVVYPTAAPRPPKVVGEGFGVWGLKILYSSDPPYNCFPSLHVAHSLVSALACGRVHRTLGLIGTIAAMLVAVSTVFTKQHYVLDVIAGGFLALVAYALFLHRFPADQVPEFDRRTAPALALCVGALVAVGLTSFWFFYIWRGQTRFAFGP